MRFSAEQTAPTSRHKRCCGSPVTVNVYPGCCSRADFPPDRPIVYPPFWTPTELMTMQLNVPYSPVTDPTQNITSVTIFFTDNSGNTQSIDADPSLSVAGIPGLDPTLYTNGTVDAVYNNAQGPGPASNVQPIPPITPPPGLPTIAPVLGVPFWTADPTPTPIPPSPPGKFRGGLAGRMIRRGR